MKPFLRWVGGKPRLVPEIVSRFPKGWMGMRYIEPFLGSGAVLLRVLPHLTRGFLAGDANSALIEAWRYADPSLVKVYGSRITSKDLYLETRTDFNHGVARGNALFVALNQTCFNGLWRVNSKGDFNVPYGKRKNVKWDEVAQRLTEVRAYTKPDNFVAGCYSKLLAVAGEGDLVYLDPPYLGTFDAYTEDGFDWSEHVRLEELARHAVDRGANVIVSVNDTEEMHEIWTPYPDSQWWLHEVSLTHNVAAKGKDRAKVGELIITSY